MSKSLRRLLIRVLPSGWKTCIARGFLRHHHTPPQPNFSLRKVADPRIGWSRAAKDAVHAGN